MIGIDQEPNREALAALNAALGEGNYQIQYEQAENGVIGIVRTHETPSRTWKTRFSPGLAPEQVAAVWQEFSSRINKSFGELEAAPATTGAATGWGGTSPAEGEPVATPDNAPGVDHASVESGTGSGGSGGAEPFESSTADERKE